MAKVLFIQKTWSIVVDNIGVTQLSAVLKQNGHKTDILLIKANGYPVSEKNDVISMSRFSLLPKGFLATMTESNHFKKNRAASKKIIDYVKKYDPDIIGFSVMTINSEWTLKLASLLKKNGIRALIVAGGPHPTFFKDYIKNDCLDAMNVGEGEYSLLELADAVDKKADITTIKNLYAKKYGKVYKNSLRPLIDINELPFPDRSLYMKYKSFQDMGTYNFVVSRGCPYVCSFCFIHQWKKEYRGDPDRNRVRLRSVENIINEIKDLAVKVSLKKICFYDSTFNADTKWMLDFLKVYSEEINIPYTVNVRADLLNDETVKALADSGCCENVRMGIETGNEKNRRQTLGKTMSNRQIYEAVDLLRKYRIKLVVNCMYGLPGETLEEAMETVEMLQNINPYSITFMLFQPYPGLNITKKAIKDGYIREDVFFKMDNKKYNLLRSMLRQLDIDKVTNLMQLSAVAAKFPSLWPLIKKLARLKPNPLFVSIYGISTYFMLRKIYFIKSRSPYNNKNRLTKYS